MSDEGRQFNYPSWTPSDKASASKLNTLSSALQSVNQGSNFPDRIPPNSTIPVTSCRLVLTDSSRALSGLGSLDGATVANGDYILRATTSNADGKDGVYIAFAGTWQRIARLKYTPVENSVVLPHGTVMSVWDGSSSPQIWITGVDAIGARTF